MLILSILEYKRINNYIYLYILDLDFLNQKINQDLILFLEMQAFQEI
jgi:hypothetical protein